MKLFFRFAHLALDEIDNPLRLGHGAVSGDSADDDVVLVEQDHRGSDSLALRVWDYLRFGVGINVRHGRERGSEVDSNSFAVDHEREIRKITGQPNLGAARETVQFPCRKPSDARLSRRSTIAWRAAVQ